MKCNVDEEELDRQFLNISPEEFISRYLVKREADEGYQTKHKPCDFLEADGACSLGECRPENCKKFPYTNLPERLQSLYSVLDVIEVCPVAFEIWERLKEIYGFHKVS